MFMKTFIHILQNRLSNKYSDIEFAFLCFEKKQICSYGASQIYFNPNLGGGGGWVILPPVGFPLITKKM